MASAASLIPSPEARLIGSELFPMAAILMFLAIESSTELDGVLMGNLMVSRRRLSAPGRMASTHFPIFVILPAVSRRIVPSLRLTF